MDNQMIMELVKNPAGCCGCGACMNICPRDAISMVADDDGFVFPHIDNEQCIRCGLCARTCAYQKREQGRVPLRAYAAASTDTDLTMSASGGVFASIAKSVLNQGGIVFGAAMKMYNGILTPMHIAVTKVAELPSLLGSKYVQSMVGTTYREVKEYLRQGKVVLYSGTPCQIDGLYGFLGNANKQNLFTIDIVCHGVPSADFFGSYIRFLEEKDSMRVVDFTFRDKTDGWGYSGKLTAEKNGVTTEQRVFTRESSYYCMFLNGWICRENCYSCKYANLSRVGDLTIGDFWGIQKEHPMYLKAAGGELDEKKGVSCILVNSEQGEQLVGRFGGGLCLKASSTEQIAAHNEQLKRPTHLGSEREEILTIFRQKGYPGVDQWYMRHVGRFKMMVIMIMNRMPVSVRKSIKKLLGH